MSTLYPILQDVYHSIALSLSPSLIGMLKNVVLEDEALTNWLDIKREAMAYKTFSISINNIINL